MVDGLWGDESGGRPSKKGALAGSRAHGARTGWETEVWGAVHRPGRLGGRVDRPCLGLRHGGGAGEESFVPTPWTPCISVRILGRWCSPVSQRGGLGRAGWTGWGKLELCVATISVLLDIQAEPGLGREQAADRNVGVWAHRGGWGRPSRRQHRRAPGPEPCLWGDVRTEKPPDSSIHRVCVWRGAGSWDIIRTGFQMHAVRAFLC